MGAGIKTAPRRVTETRYGQCVEIGVGVAMLTLWLFSTIVYIEDRETIGLYIP